MKLCDHCGHRNMRPHAQITCDQCGKPLPTRGSVAPQLAEKMASNSSFLASVADGNFRTMRAPDYDNVA